MAGKTVDSSYSAALELVEFWRAAGRKLWFCKNPTFDRRFRERWLAHHRLAVAGQLDFWSTQSEGALALILLLDQFPRNAFRGTPRMYASDALALGQAQRIVDSGVELSLPAALRAFVYLPFAHQEDLSEQRRAVTLLSPLGPAHARDAERHCTIIERFGRFPHRNAILGRTSTAEELDYLRNGGFKG